MLEDESAVVGAAAGEALRSLTGQKFGWDTDAWQEWWEEQE
jgi:hypothetical protein